MEFIYKPSLEQLFLFLITAVSLSREDDCPYDVPETTSNCLRPYRTQINTMEKSKQTFYSGVDVETIRAICHSLFNSFSCAQDIRNSCPDTEFSDIEVVLEEVLSVAQLCQRIPSPHHFLEVYARHQNCFTRLGATSETCYQTFRIDGDSLQNELMRGQMVSVVLQQYCREFTSLVKCIRTPVELTCGKEAGELVEYLVKPSVKFSEHCKNETLSTTTTSRTHRNPSPTSPGAYSDTNTAFSAISVNSSYCTTLSLFCFILYTYIIH